VRAPERAPGPRGYAALEKFEAAKANRDFTVRRLSVVETVRRTDGRRSAAETVVALVGPHGANCVERLRSAVQRGDTAAVTTLLGACRDLLPSAGGVLDAIGESLLLGEVVVDGRIVSRTFFVERRPQVSATPLYEFFSRGTGHSVELVEYRHRGASAALDGFVMASLDRGSKLECDVERMLPAAEAAWSVMADRSPERRICRRYDRGDIQDVPTDGCIPQAATHWFTNAVKRTPYGSGSPGQHQEWCPRSVSAVEPLDAFLGARRVALLLSRRR
jgi:hypothetical protein